MFARGAGKREHAQAAPEYANTHTMHKRVHVHVKETSRQTPRKPAANQAQTRAKRNLERKRRSHVTASGRQDARDAICKGLALLSESSRQSAAKAYVKRVCGRLTFVLLS